MEAPPPAALIASSGFYNNSDPAGNPSPPGYASYQSSPNVQTAQGRSLSSNSYSANVISPVAVTASTLTPDPAVVSSMPSVGYTSQSYISQASQSYSPAQAYSPQPSQSYSPAQAYTPQPSQSYSPAQAYTPQLSQSYSPQPSQSYSPAQAYSPQQSYSPAHAYTPQQSYSPAQAYSPPQASQSSQSYPAQAFQSSQSYPAQASQSSQSYSPQVYSPAQTYTSQQSYTPPGATLIPTTPQARASLRNSIPSANLSSQQPGGEITPEQLRASFERPLTPELLLQLRNALERNVINPDAALIQAVAKTRSPDMLYAIGLCLRSNANPNMYVNAPGAGVMHLMAYTCLVTKEVDSNLTLLALMMLKESGGSLNLPAFDDSGGRTEAKPTFAVRSRLPVRDWLRMEGVDPDRIEAQADPAIRTSVGTLLDRGDLVEGPLETRKVMRAGADSLLPKLTLNMERENGDYRMLQEAVQNLNAAAADLLIRKGLQPSYRLINQLLLQCRRYLRGGDLVSAGAIESIILSAVDTGTTIDRNQLELAKTTSARLANLILQRYSQPYWRKVCQTSPLSPVTERLQRIGYALNLDPALDKSGLCQSITELARYDPNTVVQAAVRRQRARMNAALGRLQEYINMQPDLSCQNFTGADEVNFFELPDLNIAYYRDGQGLCWRFDSTSFENLISSKVNPYNNEALPYEFLQELQSRDSILQHYNIRGDPVPISKALQELTAPDVVNNSESEAMVARFERLALENGIVLTSLRSLQSTQMQRLLRRLNLNIELAELTLGHAYVTFAGAVLEALRLSPGLAAGFFGELARVR